MPSYKIDVKASGPLFEGKAPAEAHKFIDKATRKLADTGRDWIRIAAMEMDRSGRGGTGRAAAGVIIYERDVGYAIFGEMHEGVVWWPWLEGVSERNQSTRFKGYHTFRTTKNRLAEHMQAIIAPELAEFVHDMGGG